ncbi:hypothetical protein HBZS_102080 [Helicobacter bizzozeronii CCUG 35545]|nr:hypothetical protein HBZS_102080 [Helicobacter bizzozeronii CCUG 35545]
MAIIGKLNSLETLFSKTLELETLYGYLASMLDTNHPHHQSLIQQQSESQRQDIAHGMHAMHIAYKPLGGVLETHRTYIDFCLVVRGREILNLSDSSDLSIQEGYDSVLDKQTYHNGGHSLEILLQAGWLAILFPTDAHTTSPHPQSLDLVHKVVAKVPANLVKLKL